MRRLFGGVRRWLRFRCWFFVVPYAFIEVVRLDWHWYYLKVRQQENRRTAWRKFIQEVKFSLRHYYLAYRLDTQFRKYLKAKRMYNKYYILYKTLNTTRTSDDL